MAEFRQVEESQTLLINSQSKRLEAEGRELVKFGFGQSPFYPPAYVIDALKLNAHRKEYSSVQGDPELRELISNFHKEHNGLQSIPENILVAPGSKSLLYSVLLSCQKADVFISAPTWVSYAPQANLAGHHIIKINTSFNERWRITPENLLKSHKSKQFKTSILIINYPGNPEGLTYSEEEIKSIVNVAKELNLLVISDEIYGLLNHRNTHISFANYYPEHTITTTGLSKWCGAGGWRLGVALLPDDINPKFKKAMIGIGSETYSCAPAPVQHAAKAAYGNYQESINYVAKQNNILHHIGKYCASKLSNAGVKVHEPDGAFYLFLDFNHLKDRFDKHQILDAGSLCAKLLDEMGVALLPSTAFGFSKNFLGARLSYVDFEDPLSNEDFTLERDCPKVVKGIEKISQWVKDL